MSASALGARPLRNLPLDGVPAVGEETGEVGTQVTIGQEAAGDDYDWQADDTSRGLQR